MVNSKLVRGYGTLAGLGFIGAALFAVPSTLLLEPVPPASSYLLTVAGLLSGFICIALPWERMDVRWLHVAGVVATIEAASAVAVFGMPYVAFFFLVAVSVAYVSPDPRPVAGHLAFIGLALLGPLAYGPESAKATLQLALVVFPLLALTTGIFAYLRMRMVADHHSYRRFAEQTLALATRIAGRPLSAVEIPPQSSRIINWTARLCVPARVAGAFAVILSVPLVGAGLAAAGVRLPSVATQSFHSVGIELPNQGEERREAVPGNVSMDDPPARAGIERRTDDDSRNAPRPDRERRERGDRGSSGPGGGVPSGGKGGMEPSGEGSSKQPSGEGADAHRGGDSGAPPSPDATKVHPPVDKPVKPPSGPTRDALDNARSILDNARSILDGPLGGKRSKERLPLVKVPSSKRD